MSNDASLFASVVIPAHNAATTIGACVESLRRQTMDPHCYELLVVDGGSTDETAKIAREAGAIVVRQAESGLAGARNAGIHAAQGEIVCFTDADCQPTSDWVAQITRPFADPDIAGCKGTYETHQWSVVARFVQVEYEDKYDRLQKEHYIDFIDTYSAAYRRSILLANGGFDETFPSLEDQELSFRLAARGYRMVFQPNAVVAHEHPATLKSYFHNKFTIGFWKAQVVRRFPERGLKDSHTPQVLKLQMILVALALAAAVANPLLPWASSALGLLLLAFVLTTVPFVWKAWAKDRGVAMASPGLLFLRALALAIGYGWGVLRPHPGVTGTQSTIGGLNYLVKRSVDVIGSIAGLAFTALVAPAIALAIKIDSPGPILFRQNRVGQGGRQFTIYKFRSMEKGAEEALQTLLPARRLVEEPAFKLKDDPRRTRVGRFLRRWSLDELPQFWNVLKGDMSLVGPRPEEVWIADYYNDWHRRRLAIKPGLTGPMQVNGRGDLPLDARIELELEYIDNYSVWRDFQIIARTLPAVVGGKGAR